MNTKRLGYIFWILAAAGTCFLVSKDSCVIQPEENRKQGVFQKDLSLQERASILEKEGSGQLIGFYWWFFVVQNIPPGKHMSNFGGFKSFFFWDISAFGNSRTFKRDFGWSAQNNSHTECVITRKRMCLRDLEGKELGGTRVGSAGKCSLSMTRKKTAEKCPAQEVNANRNAKKTHGNVQNSLQ